MVAADQGSRPQGGISESVTEGRSADAKALATSEMAQRFERNALEVATTTPEGFHSLIRSDLQVWPKLIRDARITVDVLP